MFQQYILIHLLPSSLHLQQSLITLTFSNMQIANIVSFNLSHTYIHAHDGFALYIINSIAGK